MPPVLRGIQTLVVSREAQCEPNLLIISNKNKKAIVFVTYTKQKEYLCGKFYSYETKNIRKTRVFQSYRTHVWTWNDDCVDGPEACRQELCDAANL